MKNNENDNEFSKVLKFLGQNPYSFQLMDKILDFNLTSPAKGSFTHVQVSFKKAFNEYYLQILDFLMYGNKYEPTEDEKKVFGQLLQYQLIYGYILREVYEMANNPLGISGFGFNFIPNSKLLLLSFVRYDMESFIIHCDTEDLIFFFEGLAGSINKVNFNGISDDILNKFELKLTTILDRIIEHKKGSENFNE